MGEPPGPSSWCSNHRRYGSSCTNCRYPCTHPNMPGAHSASAVLPAPGSEAAYSAADDSTGDGWTYNEPDQRQDPASYQYDDNEYEQAYYDLGSNHHISINHILDQGVFVTSPARSYLKLSDKTTQLRFLTDNSSPVCLWPAGNTDKPVDETVRLVAAEGSRIATYGAVYKDLSFSGSDETFHVKFVLANVREAILGNTFLATCGYLINMRTRELQEEFPVHPGHPQIIAGTSYPGDYVAATQLEADPIAKLIAGFVDIFEDATDDAPLPPPVGLAHFIPTTGPPCSTKVRPMKRR